MSSTSVPHRFCSLCGQKLGGRFFTYLLAERSEKRPLVVCIDCETTAPRCRLCGRPMAAWLAQDGICAACLAERPRCIACGQPVGNGFRTEDGSQRVYCRHCAQTRPRCLACNVPVGPNGRLLPDGRYRCSLCDKTAIDDPEQAQQLYNALCAMLATHLGLKLNVPTPLVPVDRGQLEAVLTALGRQYVQGRQRLHGIYARRGVKRGIYVELGLPRVQMLQVMAHELGHAWQTEHDPLLEDPILVEGIAEWVAYKTMEAYGETRVAQHMLTRQDIYGQGLRRVLALFSEDKPIAPYWRQA